MTALGSLMPDPAGCVGNPLPLIELSVVTVRLNETEVLSDLSLSIDARRTTILGRNGSGKTTLARVIAGLVVPQSGRATVDGVDLARDRKNALRRVGVIFQNPDHQIIFPTVEEEMAFGLLQLGWRREDAFRMVRDMLSAFGRSDWLGRATHNLSHGQKQLICLMSVLLMSPSVIVMDEPYSGLDIPTRLQLMRHVDRIGASVILVTHDPGTVRHFEHAIWLDRGRVWQAGSTAEVLPVYEQQMTEWGGLDDFADRSG